MERLTNAKEAAAQRRAYEKRLEQGYPRNIPEERFLKLAAYEDTGLEPGEIEAVAGLASENCAKTAAAIDRLLADEKIVKTRGDRIRAMPDEELARQFGAQCPKKVKRVCDKRCHLCWLDWLQQPSEDGVS